LIKPPEHLPWFPGSREAFHRITANLEALGVWEPIYRSLAFVAATQAYMYLQSCRIHGPRAEITQECRQVARLLLADMLSMARLNSVLTQFLHVAVGLVEMLHKRASRTRLSVAASSSRLIQDTSRLAARLAAIDFGTEFECLRLQSLPTPANLRFQDSSGGIQISILRSFL